jgi:hypothetical protein
MSFKLNMSIDKRYKDGKIYKIVSDKTDMIYIGSTIDTLNKRLNVHKSDKKRTNFKLIFEIDLNPKIVLLEEYPCKNRKELETRERYHIENNDCINKNIPTRTEKERKKEYNKEYNKQKYICDCGSIVSRSKISRHFKSKMHLYFTNSQCFL